MRAFLSWSGERSRLAAAALHAWIPNVLDFVEPWMSELDIRAGQRWPNALARALDESRFGILLLTRENIRAPWLVFEAGALSKPLDAALVVPLLIDVDFSDLNDSPLGQFQARQLNRQGCFDLAVAFNAFAGYPVSQGHLHQRFERAWPDLEKEIRSLSSSTPQETNERQPRTVEILEVLAGIQRIQNRLDVLSGQAIKEEHGLRSPADHYAVATMNRIRAAAEQAVASKSLRWVARDIGITPMGLRSFTLRSGQPQQHTRRKLMNWYARHLRERVSQLSP